MENSFCHVDYRERLDFFVNKYLEMKLNGDHREDCWKDIGEVLNRWSNEYITSGARDKNGNMEYWAIKMMSSYAWINLVDADYARDNWCRAVQNIEFSVLSKLVEDINISMKKIDKILKTTFES